MAFTPAQEAAIHAQNRELLVSAAAGSGKTRVLVERIVWLLTEQGLSVDRLLVVTFTHAAAAEMRERLQLLLTEAATDNRALRRQAELLETAQISTLHSFCQTLVRNYFQAVEVDPQSTLGDEAQCAPLLSDAREGALEWLYEQAASGDADCAALTAKFEDAAIDRMLTELYPFLQPRPPLLKVKNRAARRASRLPASKQSLPPPKNILPMPLCRIWTRKPPPF